jgi:hypothetical protein
MLSKLIFAILFIVTSNSWATKDDHDGHLKVISGKKAIRFSGYIDGYYANDFSNPLNGADDLENSWNDSCTPGPCSSQDGGRQYTSNPLYDRQFSIGYGFMQMDFEHEDVGFRLAYHFGDIVQKMYIEETERLKDIREASATIKLTDKIKMEAGLMPSIFGFETFINKDNMHASRSYMNDFAPDYETGLRFYWEKSNYEVIKFQITNGWQENRDKNKEKALGLAYVFEKPKELIFNWGMFFGDESLIGTKTSYRWYNNIFAKFFLDDQWTIAPVLDLGWQQELTNKKKPWTPWQSFGLSVRYAINPKHAVATRYDRTRDPHTIIPELQTVPETKNGWNSNGYTLTYEYLHNSWTTFRLEGRYVKTQDDVFKNKNGHKTNEDSFVLSSIALSF